MNNLNMEMPAPGFFIKEELEAREWSQTDLAYILDISVQQLNPILSGKRAISSDMAKALGKAFDVAPEFFSNLQANYDLYKSGDADPSIERRAKMQEHYPIREMIKRGWLQDIKDVSLLEMQLSRFFQKSDVNDIPYMAHAAKKANYDLDISSIQYAWLYRVHQIAAELSVPKYSRKSLEKLVLSPEFTSLRIDANEIRTIPDMLSSCGVRLIFVEALPKAKIDGACFWIKNQPVIGMSLRHDRIDNFWFVLRHELEHVLRGHGKEKEIIDDLEGENSSDSESLPLEERQANAAASEFCTPSSELRDLIARKHPYLSEKDVLGFSRRVGVHPGIVVGQVQHIRKDYSFLRKHLVKIRDFILPYAPHDGWGDVFPIEL